MHAKRPIDKREATHDALATASSSIIVARSHSDGPRHTSSKSIHTISPPRAEIRFRLSSGFQMPA
jgi:hypothetical protein